MSAAGQVLCSGYSLTVLQCKVEYSAVQCSVETFYVVGSPFSIYLTCKEYSIYGVRQIDKYAHQWSFLPPAQSSTGSHICQLDLVKITM